MQLSPHFKLEEFLSPDSRFVPPDVLENLKRLCARLEEVRKHLGDKPLIITSGYRTPEHNKKVGGASRSFHLYGMAADFVVPGMSPQKVQTLLDDWWEGGMEYAPRWTHLDIRPYRARFRP